MAAGKELLLFQWGQFLFFLLFILTSWKNLRYLLFSILLHTALDTSVTFWKNIGFRRLVETKRFGVLIHPRGPMCYD